MLIPKDTPEGYTRKGMKKGWMRPKPNPALQKIKKENAQLKATLADLMDRLEKLEKKSK